MNLPGNYHKSPRVVPPSIKYNIYIYYISFHFSKSLAPFELYTRSYYFEIELIVKPGFSVPTTSTRNWILM